MPKIQSNNNNTNSNSNSNNDIADKNDSIINYIESISNKCKNKIDKDTELILFVNNDKYIVHNPTTIKKITAKVLNKATHLTPLSNT